MPSPLPLPTLTQLLDAYRAGVHGTKDPTADLHRGSSYDVFAGVGAILFLREATRDRDIFRAVYFDHAEGGNLDTILDERFQNPRVDATAGTGKAALHRISTAAAGGTFWRGTRIAVLSPGADTPRIFIVATDTPASSTATTALINIEADVTSNAQGINTVESGAVYMRVDDPLWDMSWVVDSVICAPGTVREQDQEARARVRQDRLDARVGYIQAIADACVADGATTVALFASNFFGTNPGGGSPIGFLDAQGFGDVGLNRVFVGDSGFTANEALLRRCRLAMDRAAVCGTDVQVYGMVPTTVTLNITVHLWNDPGNFDAASCSGEAENGILNYFRTRQNAFYFKYAAIRGSILRSVRDVQAISFDAGSTPEPVLTQIFNAVPVPRYGVEDASVSVTIAGPA